MARPDLLALGALLHDIGKGRGVDHSVLGADLVIPIGERLGMSPPDIDMLSKMVRHHLLLPITATRSDLNDPKTIEAVSEALGGDPQLLELLHALIGGGLEGHRSGGVERLEGLAGRGPGAPLPDGDGG